MIDDGLRTRPVNMAEDDVGRAVEERAETTSHHVPPQVRGGGCKKTNNLGVIRWYAPSLLIITQSSHSS
jgi:hypothetical protein